MDSFLNLKKAKADTRAFYTEIEKLFQKKSGKNADIKSDLTSLKRVLYNELDDLFIGLSDIEVNKLIGKGATSEVFIGQYQFCSVAIKKVKLQSLSPKQAINIIMEMSCLKKVKHPNVISLYGIAFDPQNQTVYMVTELCEQLSLRSFFKKFKDKIPSKVKYKIILDIAKALFHIHGSKPLIVHRDVKPENIFLTGDLKAKLGDFG